MATQLEFFQCIVLSSRVIIPAAVPRIVPERDVVARFRSVALVCGGARRQPRRQTRGVTGRNTTHLAPRAFRTFDCVWLATTFAPRPTHLTLQSMIDCTGLHNMMIGHSGGYLSVHEHRNELPDGTR